MSRRAAKGDVMELSDSMRLGATFRPQVYGMFFGLVDGDSYGSCALGAAAEGFYGQPFDLNVTSLGRMKVELFYAFPALRDCVTRCPACPEMEDTATLWVVLGYLNDVHRWTREQQADWVASLGY